MNCHGRSYQAKADAQRQGWVAALRQINTAVDVVFFTGQSPHGRPPKSDEVFLDVPDTYDGLPLKVQAIMRWAQEHGPYEYVAKADDDVYMVPERVATLPLKGGYIGRFRGPCGGFPAHFASGFTYWLGRREQAIVANTQWNGDWMDERWIANTLAHFGIYGNTDEQNYLVTGPFTPPGEIRLQAGTVYCQYGPKELTLLHEFFGNKHPVMQAGLKPAFRATVTAAQLSALIKDSIPLEKTKRYHV